MPQARTAGTARGVQSLARAVDLLDLLADAGGRATLSELTAGSGLPAPTTHRLLATLVERGHVRRERGRRYALGPRLVRLGEVAGRVLGDGVRPVLAELVAATGESANLAGVDGDAAVYLAQVPSPHAMRMFTEVGARVPLHSTGVGKALLATMEPSRVEAVLARAGMVADTRVTVTDPGALRVELDTAWHRGWVVDDGEHEVGVRCVAASVPGAPSPWAVSISGPAARLGPAEVERAGPLLRAAAVRLSAELAGEPEGAVPPPGPGHVDDGIHGASHGGVDTRDDDGGDDGGVDTRDVGSDDDTRDTAGVDDGVADADSAGGAS